MLTTFDEDDPVASAIRAGAVGYLLKGTPIDDIVNILQLALRGTRRSRAASWVSAAVPGESALSRA